MKWYDSFKYKPVHGSQFFAWDRKENKQIHLNAFFDDWIPNPDFPIWAYVFDGLEPVELCKRCEKTDNK